MYGILEYKGLIVLGIFALLFGFERIWPAVKSSAESFKRVVKNILFWPLNIALSLAVILPVSYFASQHALWIRPEWFSGWIVLFMDIIFLDLFIFAWHCAVHRIQFLWRFHEVHHLDEHLDTTSAIRFHFGEILFGSFVRGLFIILTAVPFYTVIVFEILVLGFTLFHHSNISLPRKIEGLLSKLIVTPAIHWVHHHAVREDTDSNYGTIFSFWDILFQTQSNTKRFEKMKIGVEGLRDRSFIRLLIKPFQRRGD